MAKCRMSPGEPSFWGSRQCSTEGENAALPSVKRALGAQQATHKIRGKPPCQKEARLARLLGGFAAWFRAEALEPHLAGARQLTGSQRLVLFGVELEPVLGQFLLDALNTETARPLVQARLDEACFIQVATRSEAVEQSIYRGFGGLG